MDLPFVEENDRQGNHDVHMADGGDVPFMVIHNMLQDHLSCVERFFPCNRAVCMGFCSGMHGQRVGLPCMDGPGSGQEYAKQQHELHQAGCPWKPHYHLAIWLLNRGAMLLRFP
jgi:hypothetical protein